MTPQTRVPDSVPGPPGTRRVVFVLLPGVNLLDLGGPAQVFDVARRFGASYDLLFCAAEPQVLSSQGLPLGPLSPFPTPRPDDLVIIPGPRLEDPVPGRPWIEPAAVAWLRIAWTAGAHLASVCTGAAALGEAGLLDGRRCTTHWGAVEAVRARYPKALVQDAVLYTHDGPITTSAGIASGIDMALGLVSLAQALALAFFAFALIGGSVVDRCDKRRVLFVTQTLLLSLAATLAGLTLTNTATLPLVILLSFVSGVVVSFDQPARASLFPRLVPREELARATALNALAMTSAGTLGPALAGFTAATLGLSVNFGLNALSFVIALACLARIHANGLPQNVPQRQPLLGSVREGLLVVARDPALPWVVSGYGALLLLGPSPSVLLPLYAAQVLHIGGAHLGLLFLTVGAGTLLASAVQAAFGSRERRGSVFVVGLIVWASALAVFALSSSLVLSAAALLVHGAARNVVGTTAVTLMQLLAPEHARGRVMSLNALLSGGLRPLGDFGLSAAMAGTTLLCGGLVGGYALILSGLLTRLGQDRVPPMPRVVGAGKT